MQDIWYGDRRDRVKWGGLIYLANENNSKHITQVAFYRRRPNCASIEVNDKSTNISPAVWNHFSSLRLVNALCSKLGITVTILDQEFNPTERAKYFEEISMDLVNTDSTPKIVFLDPDTGIAAKKPKAQHVSVDEIRCLWNIIKPKDIMVCYQHAHHSKNWLTRSVDHMRYACNNYPVTTITGKFIANDIALLVVKKEF